MRFRKKAKKFEKKRFSRTAGNGNVHRKNYAGGGLRRGGIRL